MCLSSWHLLQWYTSVGTTPLMFCIHLFFLYLQGTDSYSAYAVRPRPCYARKKSSYVKESEDETKCKPKDICFHLLKLFSKRSHRLEKVLCPDTHTSDTLDYQLWYVKRIDLILLFLFASRKSSNQPPLPNKPLEETPPRNSFLQRSAPFEKAPMGPYSGEA